MLTTEGKKLAGVLSSVSSDAVVLTVEKTIKEEGAKRKKNVQEEITLSFKNIKTTKLIIRLK